MTNQRPQLPLFVDETTLTIEATSGTTILNCDPTDRHFFPGSKLLLVVWDPDTKLSSSRQVLTINQVLSSSIETIETVSGNIPVGSSVYPLFVADAKLHQPFGSLHTTQHQQIDMDLAEYVGTTALPPYVAPGTLPPGEPTYRGLPVFSIPHTWTNTKQGIQKHGKTSAVGQGVVLSPVDADPIDTGSLNFIQLDRPDAKRLTSFWDSRGGETFPFWYPIPSHNFTAVTKHSDTAWTITAPVELTDLSSGQRLIAFWKIDGSVQIVHVIFAVTSGPLHTIDIDEGVTENLSEIEMISWATLARFSGEYVERWQSTKAMKSKLKIQGLQWNEDASCSGPCCEYGNCCNDPADCDDPPPPGGDDPDLPPWEPPPSCTPGLASSVPYYFDNVTGVWSQFREPIRAADLQMSESLVVQIKDTFELDTLHPHGSDLSDELKDILYGSHLLLFEGSLDRSAKSRNPYHTRITGTDPVYSYGFRSGGELVSASPYWEKIVDYKINEGLPEEEDHTLSIRIYGEWVDQTAVGGDSDYGMWGTAWILRAWSTEVVPDYVEDTPYAPFNNISFIHNDPFVGGAYEGEPTANNKYAHPQTLFIGMIPTSYHAPVGYDWHSLLNRDQFFHECFQISNGAPWSTGGAANALHNSVFGTIFGGTNCRALGSLGGGVSSEVFEHIALENSAGTGMTLLKPTRPGWDEAVGDLILGASDVTIDVCLPSQTAIDPCEGHPLDPVDSNGGTPACFRTNVLAGMPDPLCYSTSGSSSVVVQEQCVTLTTDFDEFCCPEALDCDSTPWHTSFSNVSPEKWSFAFGAPQSGRSITFKQYVDNPNYTLLSFPPTDFCDLASPFADWSQDIGSAIPVRQNCPGTGTADVEVSSSSGNATLNGIYAYSPSGDVEDGTIGASLIYRANQRAGLGFRSEVITGSPTKGYFGLLDRIQSKLIIYKITATDTWVVVTELILPSPQPITYSMTLEAKGHTITFVVTGLGSLQIEDCDFQSNGAPCLVMQDESAIDDFEEIAVLDDNWQKLEITATVLDKQTISVSVNPLLTKGNIDSDLCNFCVPADCPDEDCFGSPSSTCPCSSICKGISGFYSIASSAYPLGAAEPHNSNHFPPNAVGNCDEPGCDPPYPSCDDCPPPFPYLSWNTTHCGEGSESDNVWKGGISGWLWAELVCP
jgi:hypothetical protein